MNSQRIEIAGDSVCVYRDDRSVQQSKLAEVLVAAARRIDSSPSCGVLPPGVRFWKERGDAVALAIELGPHTRAVKWLADDSPRPYGSDACYQRRILAFPYIVILIALVRGCLTGYQQLFYRREPLCTDGELLLPNLLNVSPDSYDQKAWLCLANIDDISELSWTAKVDAIGKHVFCGGWNRSSDIHEGTSYFALMRDLDSRIASAGAWEEASRESPWFMLELPWKSAGLTLAGEIDRMLAAVSRVRPVASAEDLQGLITRLSRSGTRRRRRCFRS